MVEPRVEMFDRPSYRPDNPAVKMWTAVDTYWHMLGGKSYAPAYKMKYNNPMEMGYTYFTAARSMGWGRDMAVWCVGQDSYGLNVYAFGRPPRRRYTADHLPFFVLGPDGRFTVNHWRLRERDREILRSNTFLRAGWEVRKRVWWAEAEDENFQSHDLRRIDAKIPYLPENLLSSYLYGWMKLVPAEQFSKDIFGRDNGMRIATKWAIAAAWDQHPPGRNTTGTNFAGAGSYEWSHRKHQDAINQFTALRERRYRRYENRARRERGLAPLSVRPPRIQTSAGTLVGDDAVTAIVAAFDVSTPARVKKWNREAQGGPDEQRHEVEASHPTGP